MNTLNRCCLCNKELGAIFCTGCKLHFCMKDLRIHRQKLSTELDEVIYELQDRITKMY